MKQYLIVDTSMSGLLVGLGAEDAILAYSYFPDQRAVARSLSHHVRDLMVQNGVSREALTQIRISQGPGSFTGIRMGLAWAYGFSGGDPEIPLVGMSALEVLAEVLHSQRSGDQVRTVVFLENKGTAGYVTVVEAGTATYAYEVGENPHPYLLGDPAQETVRWVRPWANLEATPWAQSAGRALTEMEYLQLVLQGMLRKKAVAANEATGPMPQYLRLSTAEEALEKKKRASL